jgi:hypothetical protein
MPPDPWPRRVLNAIPPMQDRLWVGILLFTILMCGVTLGLTLRDLRRAATVSEPSALQHHLNSLEQRVRALEQRP